MAFPGSILVVCTGNICRSPTAEAVLRDHFNRAGLTHIHIDSAATHSYHVGEAPDSRSIAAAKTRGYHLAPLRARKLAAEDAQRFDLLLGMDEGHVEHMQRLFPTHTDKIFLLMEYAGHTVYHDVPDPYYGGRADFEHVLDLVEWAAQALVQKANAGQP